MKPIPIALAVAVIGLLLTCSAVDADDWSLPREVKDIEFKFGQSRLVLHYDSTQTLKPKYDLRIYAKDQLMATHEQVGFEQVFADPKTNFFLGVSNSGLIKQAYVIFDRQGRIIKEQKHDFKKVQYTKKSLTLDRKWYDALHPNPEFVIKHDELVNVRIQGSNGKPVSLLTSTD